MFDKVGYDPFHIEVSCVKEDITELIIGDDDEDDMILDIVY